MKQLLPALGTILLLSACATPDPYEPLSAWDLYQCDHGEQVKLSIGDMAQNAAIYRNDIDVTLSRFVSPADGIAFKGEVYTLYHNQETGEDALAVIERDGVPYLTNCRIYAYTDGRG